MRDRTGVNVIHSCGIEAHLQVIVHRHEATDVTVSDPAIRRSRWNAHHNVIGKLSQTADSKVPLDLLRCGSTNDTIGDTGNDVGDGNRVDTILHFIRYAIAGVESHLIVGASCIL